MYLYLCTSLCICTYICICVWTCLLVFVFVFGLAYFSWMVVGMVYYGGMGTNVLYIFVFVFVYFSLYLYLYLSTSLCICICICLLLLAGRRQGLLRWDGQQCLEYICICIFVLLIVFVFGLAYFPLHLYFELFTSLGLSWPWFITVLF